MLELAAPRGLREPTANSKPPRSPTADYWLLCGRPPPAPPPPTPRPKQQHVISSGGLGHYLGKFSERLRARFSIQQRAPCIDLGAPISALHRQKVFKKILGKEEQKKKGVKLIGSDHGTWLLSRHPHYSSLK